MVTIIDYGVGNLFSLSGSVRELGADVCITADPAKIHESTHIFLPGVGAFKDAADKLKELGLDEILKEETRAGKPLLGICLGMQLLHDKSYEFGEHEGLGLIRGVVKPIEDVLPKVGENSFSVELTKSDIKSSGFAENIIKSDINCRQTDTGNKYLDVSGLENGYKSLSETQKKTSFTYKIPHIGWNALKFEKSSPLFKYINEGDYVYFVHSYWADCEKESLIATTEYGASLTAAVQNENVFGTQFHPEKSGTTGLAILRAFLEM